MAWPWTKTIPNYPRGGTGQSPGSCEYCGGYGMVCLNGQRFLCWDHYCQELQQRRVANQQFGVKEG